ALLKGRLGERYILGGQNVRLWDMLSSIAQIVGRSPPKLQLPRATIYPLALAAEAVARMTGREPFVTTDGLRMAKHHMFCISDKAERELGYRARPYVDGLSDAITWFGRGGYLG
ncbi:MAG TPA: NAD-dependent dehydratase, partial [Xanthobacteraceae bacterium]|nr:NAD-dependent dehydratase [Xanthobacteraceae bacterium]